MSDNGFARLVARWKEGDKDAADLLVAKYGKALTAMVRQVMPKALRGEYDSTDFTQAVWQSVLVHKAPVVHEFENSTRFRGFLRAVARNKVAEEYRRKTRIQKYDVAREEPLVLERDGREHRIDPPSDDPTPSTIAHFSECWELVLREYEPRQVEMIRLRLAGRTFREIAAEVGRSEAAVRKFLTKFEEGPV